MKKGWERIRRYKVVTNAVAYISGSFLQKAMGFILVPLWARFLTPEDYGIIGTLAAYGAMLSALLLMGLHGAVVRDYYDYLDDLEEQKRYVSSVMLFLLVISTLIIVALNSFGADLWERYTANKIPFNPYVRLMLLTAYVGIFIQFVSALYQARQKAREFVFIQYGRFLLTVLATFVLVVAFRLGAFGMMLSQLISGVVVVIVVMYFAIKEWFTWSVDWKYVRAGLVFGLPLVPHALSAWILDSSDRLILEHYVSLSELGLYNLGYSLGLVLMFLVTGINQAWSPYYYRLMQTSKNPETQILKFSDFYVALIGAVCLLGVLFAGDVVYVLFPAKYYGTVRYIAPVLVGSLLVGFYYLVNKPLFHYKKTQVIPLLSAAAALLNILLNLWLVPIYGAVAAAWTTALTNGCLFILYFYLGRRYQNINFPMKKYGVLTSIILLSVVATTQLSPLDGETLLLKTIVMLLYAVLAYWLLLSPYLNTRIKSLAWFRRPIN